MEYALEMRSGAMIYIRSFMKIGSGIAKLIIGRGGGTQTHEHTRWSRISLLDKNVQFSKENINK
jgi:hypothetical protein